jgi:hypothetical protein
MKQNMQQPTQACWRSSIFGDSYDSSISYVEIEELAAERERTFIAAFTPIVAGEMPESPPLISLSGLPLPIAS